MSWFEKLKLLVWKNFLLQKRHKFQTAFEIISPVIFSLFLILVRCLMHPESRPATSYPPFEATYFNVSSKFNLSEITKQNQTVAFSPDHPLLRDVITNAMSMIAIENFGLMLLFSGLLSSSEMPKPKGFKNAKELEKNLIAPNAMNYYIFGIQFDDEMQNATEWPDNITLTLRFPAVMRTSVNMLVHPLKASWRTNLLFPLFRQAGPREPEDMYGGKFPGYASELFLSFQHALSQKIIENKTGTKIKEKFFLRRYPQLAYKSDDLLIALERFVSMIIMMCFAYTFVNTVRMVTMEKELQLKETMTIMGLPSWLHWLAWFIKQFSFLFFSIALMVLLFKIPFNRTKDGYQVAVFTHTHWTVLFFFMMLFVISALCFSFLISVFFSKANTAASFMGLAWFTAYSVYMLTQILYEDITLQTKLILSLISNTALGYAFQMLVISEGSTQGLQWSNFFKPISYHDKFMPGHVALMLVLDSILYMILAMYIEKIKPGIYGVPLPWYFPFTKSFWRPRKHKVAAVTRSDGTDSEYNDALLKVIHDEEPKGVPVGVNIKNLTKVYKGTKRSVDNLNLRVYENEITVLLGHNGAGKTTTISMLTGLVPPTSGSAQINGYDIVTETELARRSLGICPQHNVLFPDLTVTEHIHFYSRLKGVPPNKIKQEVEHFLKLLELEEKKDVVSSKLSGGQKRRLSVGAAMCGNSRVVLLDEPTSGLDPAARRALWDLLQKEKKGRSMILTTHFMDEADLLGDRIAIMSGGKLQCVGTPYFLKKHYGIGYKLTIVKNENCNVEDVTKFFRGYVPDVKENTNIGSELTYILPNEYVAEFPEMLKEFENRKQTLKISSYGLTVTSLEEVFMKTGVEDEDELANGNGSVVHDIANGNGSAVHFQTDKAVIVPIGNTGGPDHMDQIPKLRGFKLLRNHIKAMFLKQFYNTIRNKVTCFIQFIMPIINITISVVIARSWKFIKDLPPLTLSLESGFDKTETLVAQGVNVTENSLIGRTYNAYKDYFKNSTYPGMHLRDIGAMDVGKFYLKLSEKDLSRVQYETIVGATFEKNKITSWFSNYGYHDSAISLALTNNAVLNALSPGSRLNVVNHPLPYSIENLVKVMASGSSMGFQFAFNIGFCLAFVTAFLVIFAIKERTSGAKLLQSISGVRPAVFWGTAYLWDWLWLSLVYIGIVATLACYREQSLSTPAELGRVFLVLSVFSLAMIPIHYLASFFFTSSPATGFAKMCFINIFVGCMPFIITEVLRLPSVGSPRFANIFDGIFSPLPIYCVSRSLRDMSVTSLSMLACDALCDSFVHIKNCSRATICKRLNISVCCIDDDPFLQWSEPGIGRYLFTMLVMAILSFTILLVKEYELVNKLFYKTRPLPPPPIPETEDSDVAAEREAVTRLTRPEYATRSLIVKDLTKYFGNFLAVNRLTFGVSKGECFGLLGINGAGKTSTFKMLTGDTRVSSGDAFVHGMSVKTDIQQVYRYIGYCPQFDGLLDNLTARETLRIFCLLRGIPSSIGAARAERLAHMLGFNKHFDKKVLQCSGGTKRKISAAVALLGDSPLIFLDEPTTGMDPASKRLVWSAISSAVMCGRSVVLTSHSMEECEALCTTLTIMSRGSASCLGPTQHLKNKFSRGFSLIVKCKSGPELAATLEKIKVFVTTTFREANLIDTYLGISTFYIQDPSLLWWQLFHSMEEARKHYDIEDYSVSQTTLEQVFLSFTRPPQDGPGKI